MICCQEVAKSETGIVAIGRREETAEEAWHGMDSTACVQGGKGKKRDERETRAKSGR